MKYIAFVLILLLLFPGCVSSSMNDSHSILNESTPIESGNNYEIYDISKYAQPFYQYFVFDNKREIMDSGILEQSYPNFKSRDGILEIHIGYGTGVWQCRYYDANKKLVSVWFNQPHAFSNNLVVYAEPRWNDGDRTDFIVVRDIFHEDAYYSEFERPLKTSVPIVDAVFINDGSQLKVTYLTGNDYDYNEVTEVLDLKTKVGTN